MKLGLLLGSLLLATSASAQESAKSWGCLWIEKFDPGEKLLQWCVIEKGSNEIPCYYFAADATEPAEDLEPWVIVPAADVTETFAPNEGPCPRLPADVPAVTGVRG